MHETWLLTAKEPARRGPVTWAHRGNAAWAATPRRPPPGRQCGAQGSWAPSSLPPSTCVSFSLGLTLSSFLRVAEETTTGKRGERCRPGDGSSFLRGAFRTLTPQSRGRGWPTSVCPWSRTSGDEDALALWSLGGLWEFDESYGPFSRIAIGTQKLGLSEAKAFLFHVISLAKKQARGDLQHQGTPWGAGGTLSALSSTCVAGHRWPLCT